MTDKYPANFENLQLELKDTLERLKCLEVVAMSSRHGDIRFLCKVHDEPRWLSAVQTFLGGEGSWYSFIGKKYFLNRGKLVYGWVLIFEAEDMDAMVMGVRKLWSTVGEDLGTPADEEPAFLEVALPWENDYMTERKKRRVKNIR
tara:strand:+ start:757 stop:1191 length:435 start_codon:yes stop_codon:yes gene_type:complete